MEPTRETIAERLDALLRRQRRQLEADVQALVDELYPLADSGARALTAALWVRRIDLGTHR